MAKIKDANIVKVRKGLFSYKENAILNNQEQQILIYGLYKLDANKKDLSVEFSVNEMNHVMGVRLYNYSYNESTVNRLLGFKVIEKSGNKIIGKNAFASIEFTAADGVATKENQSKFKMVFNPLVLPEIMVQKKLYNEFGLTPISHFKCKYTIILYEYLKEHFFDYTWRIQNGLPRTEEMFDYASFVSFFNIDTKNQKEKGIATTSNFKARVWKPAMDEINKFTGYKINIETFGRGENYKFKLTVSEIESISKDKKYEQLPVLDISQAKEEKDERSETKYQIQKRINYNLLETNTSNKELLDQIVDVIVDLYCSKNKSKTIKGKTYLIDDVKKVFDLVNEKNVRETIEKLSANKIPVTESKEGAYILSTLFTAIIKDNQIKENHVNHDKNEKISILNNDYDSEEPIVTEEKKEELLKKIKETRGNL